MPAETGGRLLRLGLCLSLIVAGVSALAGCGSDRPDGPPDMLFVSTRDADYAIFGMSLDGTHQYRLTKEKGDASSPAKLFFQVEPAWSPDAQRIAFVSGRDGVGHVFVMDADGTGTRRITDTKQDDTHPTWSPDGTKLVFAREGALFQASAEGGPATRVGRGLGSAADPEFSPDGTQIAYDYRIPGYQTREVWVMNSDGTGARQLTKLGAQSGAPAWSPDGKRLAFQSNAGIGHFDIFSIGVEGGAVRRETISALDTIQPQWSPDGSTLAYSRDGAIWVKDPTGEHKLTSGDGNDSNPEWRPESKGGS